MSNVTDIILSCSRSEEYREDGEEDRYACIEAINTWLEERDFPPLRDMTNAAGGDKYMQAVVYGGAFNYLPEEELIRVVWSQPWVDRQAVRLLVQSEEETAFRVLYAPDPRPVAKQNAFFS